MNLVYRLARLVLLAAFLNSFWLSGFAQSITVAGPGCAIAGPVYMYTISGQWQPGSTVRVCLTGGTLVDSGGTCAGGGGILSFVRVSWDSGGQTSGTIKVTSSLGDTTLAIHITTPLKGGQIYSSVANQSTDSVTTPATLTVSAATGGACQPAYAYQWQQSLDNAIWKDIPGATNPQFPFARPLTQIAYFRRVVTDRSANVLAYSNVAKIFVNTPMPAPVNQSNTQQ